MRLHRTGFVGLLLSWACCLSAQSGAIRQGKIKNIDLDKMILTLTIADMDRVFLLTPNTQVPGAKGKDLKEILKGFKVGAEIDFKSDSRNGKDVIIGLRLRDGKVQPKDRPKLPKADLAKLKPLSELGNEEYQGSKGGFYPDGKNERPAEHEAAGLRLAKQVQPFDAEGKPSPSGKIVLLSVGMSNTSQASQGFQKHFQADQDHRRGVVFVNGAQGGMTAAAIQDPDDMARGAKYWTTVDDRLKAAGVTRYQVQVVWIKQADAGPSQGFPGYAKKLQEELTRIVQLFPGRFPNVKLVYLTSRTYGGFATTGLNPEPYAFESGFSVKWLIEEQIKGNPALNYDPAKGKVQAPWLSWGPYFWASGTTPRKADGFFYEEKDFTPNDGTHLSGSGQDKVGRLLLDFLKNDSTARIWFMGK